ncbi:4-hydroxy-3-methylbut-2-enyl diphosphate reductase [Helicobacter cholecystus]|uniref:4-hydroxy-3-methylbut-2-enyl diphosphate reductase n=1 Tax=Helicobacter cholecystus TaxID=45498 RepID=A0A3D8ITE5_9HELI|nr:4-hydroxy-3-methylbut-2-enyl diphosphate reductase [Helicobacter cholecystus]RDU68175.1 4-hydroxy-3-methylbut-2-enyl diphosphate reductase [Helicobacter cholecystus]VEJ26037.1 4-hydroxy-3-methylbut-2-enyl diphosphate reductase [Helicobacter cholecystus]
MKVKLAKSFGFCFGVKRAIKIAQKGQDGVTLGELIHNQKEIDRLKQGYGVRLAKSIDEICKGDHVIVRTHGIPKDELKKLEDMEVEISDATCPYVTKPQKIVEQVSAEGYQVVIFGDIAHPEVKSVMSYSHTQAWVVKDLEELKQYKIPKKTALVSQTTKQTKQFYELAQYLLTHSYETRVFNTICNATFQNQDSAKELAKEVDIMIVVGGLTSSNTKQLFEIAKRHCADSYLIEDENGLELQWFEGKKICGITAGASTPDWIIQKVKQKIQEI